MAKTKKDTDENKKEVIQKAFDYLTPDWVLEYEAGIEEEENQNTLDDIKANIKKGKVLSQEIARAEKEIQEKKKGNLDKEILDILEESGFKAKY